MRPGFVVVSPPTVYSLTIAGSGEDLSATGDLDIKANLVLRTTNGQAALVSASEAVQKKAAPLLQTWNQLQSELPALNRKLRSAGLTPVRPELAPPRDLNVADEE